MSHFTVLVIGPDPEKQLAPFQENNMGDCPREYMSFNDIEDEHRKEYEEDSVEKVVMPDGRLLSVWDEEFKKRGKNIFETTTEVPEGLERRQVPFKELFSTFEEFMSEWHGYKKRDEEKNRYGHWENPNRKWDWYSLGGRWMGFFKLKRDSAGVLGRAGVFDNKPDLDVDQTIKGAVDFEGMRNIRGEQAAKRYDEVSALYGGVIPPLKYKWKYMLDSEEFKDKTIEEKREIYHAQPPLAKKQELHKRKWEERDRREQDKKSPVKSISSEPSESFTEEQDNFITWGDYEEFMCSKEEFVQKARDGAICTFAVIKDGKWYERGEMGWWGVVHGEKEDGKWEKEWSKLVEGVPDETLLSVYDCHI